MYLHPDSDKNIFQIYSSVQKVPFAVSRHHWSDHDLAVIVRVVPVKKYGTAYGFAVRDGIPNDHFAYAGCWTKHMEVPNAGSYQWRLIDVPEFRLLELVEEFYRDVAPPFYFVSPQEDKKRERTWIDDLLGDRGRDT